MKKLLVLIIFVKIVFANGFKIDPESKLIVAKGLEEVKENCVVCHTGRFITQNGGDRHFWNIKITLMQKAFGLWELDKTTKEKILNYLSTHYYKGWNKKKKNKDRFVPKLNLNK